MSRQYKLRGLAAAAGMVALGMVGGSPAALAQGLQHFGVLSGGSVVGPGGQAAAGDPDGSGAVALISDDAGVVCISLLTVRIGAATAAGVREKTAGANGPLVFALTPPTGTPGRSTTCVTGPARLSLLRLKPNHFYVDVRTADFPNGALRANLF